MKELENFPKDEMREERQEKRNTFFLDSFRRPDKGMKLFCCDEKGKVECVEYKQSEFDLKLNEMRHRIEFDPEKWWTWAINMKNAKRKLHDAMRKAGIEPEKENL